MGQLAEVRTRRASSSILEAILRQEGEEGEGKGRRASRHVLISPQDISQFSIEIE